MRNSILLIVAMTSGWISSPVLAGVCEDAADAGGFIMAGRQSGKTMQSAVKAMVREDSPEQVNEIAKSLIKMAYEEPLYHSDELKKAAITEFKNKIYQSCFK